MSKWFQMLYQLGFTIQNNIACLAFVLTLKTVEISCYAGDKETIHVDIVDR